MVTGASAGIGAAITKALVKAGVKVVGCGRRLEKLEELAATLAGSSGKLYARQCDVEQESDIKEMFEWIEGHQELGRIDICINNAGMSTAETLLEGKYENWRKMLNINVLALCLCTQLSVELMKKKNIDDGHIVMISSISGHRVPPNPSTRFYAAAKHAVRALVEGWRQEMRDANSNIRISSLSPGLVATEFQGAMYPDDPEKAKEIQNSIQCLQAEDMAASVEFILTRPQYMEINDIVVRPTQQKF